MEIFTQYSLWLLVPIVILAAGLAFFLYYKDKNLQKINKSILYTLFILRFSVLLILCFLLLMPVIKHSNIYFDKPLIILSQDNSESVGLLNSIDSMQASNYQSNIKHIYNLLSKKYETKFLTFGDRINDSLNFNFDEKETNYSQLFDEINKKYANYNIGALIIASDGIYNKAGNPIYAAKKFTFPIYTIALGDTAKKRDLIIKGIHSNKIAFLGDMFPIEVLFNSFGYKNKTATVSIIHKGKTIDKKSIEITANDFSKQLEFSIAADEKSLQNYTVTVDYKKDEFSHKNNSKQFVIDIVDDKKKILILYNSVHPDIAAIKNALKSNKNVISKSINIDKANKVKLTDYQLVIFHQLPSSNSNIQNIIKTLNTNNIPSFYVLGTQTNINKFNRLNLGLTIDNNKGFTELTLPEINETFQLFEYEKDFANFISECNPLSSFFGTYKLDKQVEILLYQNIKGVSTKKPLLAFRNSLYTNQTKMGILFGEGIWHWRIKDYMLNDNHEQFDAFINKIVQFLALDIKKERFMVFCKNIVNENEEVIIRAELYNQAYGLYNQPDVLFELKNSKGEVFKYSFSKSGKSYLLNIGKLALGDYQYKASTTFEGKKYKKTGKIRIIPVNIEHQNLSANHLLLRKLAKQSGGKLFYPKQSTQLVNHIENNDSIKAISHSVTDLIDLIQFKWLLFVIILFLSIEWFIRKLFGTH